MEATTMVTVIYPNGEERDWELKKGTTVQFPSERVLMFEDVDGRKMTLILGSDTDIMIQTMTDTQN